MPSRQLDSTLWFPALGNISDEAETLPYFAKPGVTPSTSPTLSSQPVPRGVRSIPRIGQKVSPVFAGGVVSQLLRAEC